MIDNKKYLPNVVKALVTLCQLLQLVLVKRIVNVIDANVEIANSVVFDIVTAKGNVLNNVFPVVVVEKTMFLNKRVHVFVFISNSILQLSFKLLLSVSASKLLISCLVFQ